jgi:hypothetical protein
VRSGRATVFVIVAYAALIPARHHLRDVDTAHTPIFLPPPTILLPAPARAPIKPGWHQSLTSPARAAG